MMAYLIEELEDLRFKIRNNTATVADYLAYEKIITDNGLSDELLPILKRYGFKSWSEYILKRKTAKTLNERSTVNGEMLGLILGVGAALLLIWALARNNE
jgi:hypothetical protein